MQIEKFTDSQVRGILSHVDRINPNDANSDIDSERTSLNYSLTPYVNVPRADYQRSVQAKAEVRKAEWDYYRLRKAELYCYSRADVNTLAGCVISLDEKLIGQPDKAEAFFEGVTQFLCDKFGGPPSEDGRLYPNVVSATVHYDEKQLDGSAGLRGHLHFLWIPAVKIDHDKLMAKKNHIKAMEDYDYKISAKECITKQMLSTLHQEVDAYLSSHNIEGRVTVSQAGGKTVNIPVSLLKEYTERTGKTIDRELLRDMTIDRIVESLELAKNKDKSREWGHSWGDRDKEVENVWTR